MANVQKHFEEFHGKIKLSDTEENQDLREKRDIILNRLNSKMSQKYKFFNQGSYAMGTGVIPINSEYDIDVGINFEISKDDYPDPVEVKNWVYEAVKDHTSSVEMKRPCVTVTYLANGEPEFHVDLAIYAANNSDGKLYLAKGKLNSGSENKYWEVSEPQKLIGTIMDKFQDSDDRKQFKRVVRYLKRWKNIKFSVDGYAAPIGIGLTVSAYYYLTIMKDYDFHSGQYKYDDLSALQELVRRILHAFKPVYRTEEKRIVERLRVDLPVEPYCDLFEKMTDNQMEQLKAKMVELNNGLLNAKAEADLHNACEMLQAVFGSDFPVPPKDETGQRKSQAFISSSASA